VENIHQAKASPTKKRQPRRKNRQKYSVVEQPHLFCSCDERRFAQGSWLRLKFQCESELWVSVAQIANAGYCPDGVIKRLIDTYDLTAGEQVLEAPFSFVCHDVDSPSRAPDLVISLLACSTHLDTRSFLGGGSC
jgi:hypothetical protein